MAWRNKAHRIIASLCRDSWFRANHNRNGKRFEEHRPYSVPADAEALIKALNQDDEETAKGIFIRHAYDLVNV